MKEFEDYLIEQDYAKTTVACYTRDTKSFLKWSDFKGYDIETLGYKECIQYTQKLQQPKRGKTLSKSTVKHKIGSLKIYFDFLIDENYRGDNPFKNINIRGVKRTLNHNLLEFEELEDLFYSYPTRNIQPPSCPHVSIRDKVITGLMVYQGLGATALKSLKMEHINLERGKIYIPSTRKTNSRELEIKSQQILSLASYLETSREVIQNAMNCHSEAFIPQKDERFTALAWLFKKLRRINLNVKDAKQIRASVLTHWLVTHNIREVQYMAGHRYISSTERYVQDNLENLHEIIETLHPIN